LQTHPGLRCLERASQGSRHIADVAGGQRRREGVGVVRRQRASGGERRSHQQRALTLARLRQQPVYWHDNVTQL